MNKNEYIRNSLELHLFFARIMKEHAFVAFDNSHNIHLLKLSTMNHEIYQFK